MAVFLVFASTFAIATSLGDVPEKPAPPTVLAQSRLRGSSRKSSEPAFSSAAKQRISSRQFSDDDESCSAQGITPGVCALDFLARPTASPSSVAADKQELDNSRDKLEHALIAEIELALAGNHTGIDAFQLRKLEQELQPLFATLPHKQRSVDALQGGLGLAAARYLLHQHFVRQHSWHVRGLDPAGDGRLPPNAKEQLRSRVAGHLLKVMHTKVGKDGFDLKMLAIFVATLEHLLQGDQHELLKRVWSVYGLDPKAVINADELAMVLEIYLAHNVKTSWLGDLYLPSMEAGLQDIVELRNDYPGLPNMVSFIEKSQHNIAAKVFSFNNATLMADKLLQLFGEISGSTCHVMEQKIRQFRGGDQGLVKLADLRPVDFAETLGPIVQEPDEYLRQVGALDESTEQPHVAVPNYMLGPTNCDMSTSFYDLCCPSECESHKDHLERAVSMSKVEPVTVIANAVQQRLSSAVPGDQLKRLHAIAAEHAGAIPIHGRAFADWLQTVFPRDCPRTRSQDYKGVEGNLLPDANVEFQAFTSIAGLLDPSNYWRPTAEVV